MQGQASCPLNSEHPGCLAKGAQLDAGRGRHKPVIHFSPSHPKPNCPPKKKFTVDPELRFGAEEAQFRGALLESLKRQQCAFTEMQQLAEEPLFWGDLAR